MLQISLNMSEYWNIKGEFQHLCQLNFSHIREDHCIGIYRMGAHPSFVQSASFLTSHKVSSHLISLHSLRFINGPFIRAGSPEENRAGKSHRDKQHNLEISEAITHNLNYVLGSNFQCHPVDATRLDITEPRRQRLWWVTLWDGLRSM